VYRRIESAEIVKTASRLMQRVRARFPDAGLAGVAEELLGLAEESQARCESIARPNTPLRVGIISFVVLGLAGIFSVVLLKVRVTDSIWELASLSETAESILGTVVFMGAAIAFLLTLEQRHKRLRALAALTELRAIAHVIDMHQLTKDPEMIMVPHPKTDVSPARDMSPFELNRYLDYCSELLSVVSKIGALYVQSFPDAQAMGAVDDLEDLTTGLSRKIWQKIMILDRYVPRDREA
jgi:hypothetical protein